VQGFNILGELVFKHVRRCGKDFCRLPHGYRNLRQPDIEAGHEDDHTTRGAKTDDFRQWQRPHENIGPTAIYRVANKGMSRRRVRRDITEANIESIAQGARNRVMKVGGSVCFGAMGDYDRIVAAASPRVNTVQRDSTAANQDFGLQLEELRFHVNQRFRVRFFIRQ
jgi:hypothetical protein